MSRASLVIATVLLAACSGKRVDQAPAGSDAKVAPPTAATPAASPPADSGAAPGAPLAVQNSEAPPAGSAPESPPIQPAGPLTPEEQKLIDTDPKDLTPDKRRERAYALRKKIMQNPDSPTARALEDLRQAAEKGEIQPPDFSGGKAGKDEKKEGLWLDVNGNQVGGQPPAGARPE